MPTRITLPVFVYQLRRDVALDLLQRKCVHGVTDGGGGVDITVPGATLAGLSDESGDLGGYGPVFAEIARKTVMESVGGSCRFIIAAKTTAAGNCNDSTTATTTGPAPSAT